MAVTVGLTPFAPAQPVPPWPPLPPLPEQVGVAAGAALGRGRWLLIPWRGVADVGPFRLAAVAAVAEQLPPVSAGAAGHAGPAEAAGSAITDESGRSA
ncbi:hypothetical protein H7I94_22090, partial [Mycobacterium szulgai]|nr:hypothetical protein [Mycobacterium szulgai]